jgi:hypothetical protein
MNSIIQKLTSGRYIVVVSTSITYSAIVVFTAWHYVRTVSPEKLEGFAVGLVMGFAGIAGVIYKSYFDRTDRKEETKS